MKWTLIVLGALVAIGIVMYVVGAMLPVKHTATVTSKFLVSPKTLWSILTNYNDYPNWRKGMKSLTVTGPNSWTEETNGDKVNYEAERVEEYHRLITRIVNKDLPYGGYWEFEILPDGSGSELTITEYGEVYSPIFRFMSNYIFGHETTMKQYLADLKAQTG